MTQLIQSYRSMPLGQRMLVGGGVVVAAILLVVALPHILGAVVGVALFLVSMAILALVVVACLAGIIWLVRALGARA